MRELFNVTKTKPLSCEEKETVIQPFIEKKLGEKTIHNTTILSSAETKEAKAYAMLYLKQLESVQQFNKTRLDKNPLVNFPHISIYLSDLDEGIETIRKAINQEQTALLSQFLPV